MKQISKYKNVCLFVSFFFYFFPMFSQKLAPKESAVIPEKKITVCHISGEFQTHAIDIPVSALSAHLAHGDFVGSCTSDNFPLSLSLVKSDVKCFDGNDGEVSVQINFSNGNPPYQILWSNGSTSQSISNLSAGIYSVTVSISNGLSATAIATVNQPLPLSIVVSSVNESCSFGNDGKANVSVSGGTSPYSYLWNTGEQSQNISYLQTGFYSVTVTDNSFCTTTSVVNIEKESCSSQLTKDFCGATVPSLGVFVYCNEVFGATNYQWEFSFPQTNFLKTIQRGFGFTNFHLTWVPGIQYGKTYLVRVKPFVNGVWQDYGPYCELTVPAPIPYTEVRTPDCGISTNTLAQVIFCDFVPGAQNYQWEFSNSQAGFYKIVNRGSNSLSFTLSWVTGIMYGETYNVRVRANVGGEWGDFGDSCPISIVYPIPVTKVRFADCGITLSSLTQNIYCDAVPGSTDYQWEFSQQNFIFTANRNSSNTNFQLAWIPDILNGATYSVRVRAKVGGDWAEFGTACNITTPSVVSRMGGNEENSDNSKEVYPNSLNGEIFVSHLQSEKREMKIYNMLGEIVYAKQSAPNYEQLNLPPGIYILNVQADGKNHSKKIILK